MTIPVIAAFIDGLKPESIEHMPFVSTFAKPSRIRTELGYSMTCHPSMYTGVHPDQHLSWFIWQRNEEESPFRWLRQSGLDRLPESWPLKYGLYKLTRKFHGNSAYFSVPFPTHVPLPHWHCFDVTEKKFWDEDHFNPHFPTIFEFFRRNGIRTNILGMNKGASNAAPQMLRATPRFGDFTYLFFGDIDRVSHMTGQDSPQSIQRLRLVDRAIERWYRSARKDLGEPLFMLWSDHGHILVEERVDVHAIFRKHRLDLNDFIHMVDSNYLRFWFRNEAERARVERVLPDLGKGFVITDPIAEKYHVKMPDNRYGDLIFYLEAPAMFEGGDIRVLGKKRNSSDVSMHGYSPENRGVDGTLLSNRRVRLSRTPILQDIPPTLLRHFNIPVPEYMVGDALW